MTRMQEEFTEALIELGLSQETLIVVCIMIQSPEDMTEMVDRIIVAEDSGKKITDSLVLQIMVDMMKEASPAISQTSTE